MTEGTEKTNPSDGSEPPIGQIIAPGPTPASSIDVGAQARKRAAITPTDRLDAMVALHMSELKADKATLQVELRIVRTSEIPHLRDDVRWLEARETTLLKALTTLHTSYEYAISFNWLSFALIAIGGSVVSYATFLLPPGTADRISHQKVVATSALIALLIGVIVQAFLSHLGGRTLRRLPKIDEPSQRPAPNPTPPESRSSVRPAG